MGGSNTTGKSPLGPGMGTSTYGGQSWKGSGQAPSTQRPVSPNTKRQAGSGMTMAGKGLLEDVKRQMGQGDVPEDVADAINTVSPLAATNKRMAASRGRAGSLLTGPAPASPNKSLLGG